MVMTACTECHGQKLEGRTIGAFKTPSLAIAAAYSANDFSTLMRTGVGLGGRNLGLMTEMGQIRFVNFSDQEVRAIRSYLSLFVQQGGIEPP
jgi:cytochrome c553